MIQWVTNNWGIKLLSLFLAIGLWYYAVQEEGVEVKRSIPLEIVVKNPQMSVLRTSVKHVWVTFAAPRNLLSDLTSKDIKATHEIGSEASTAGDYSFRLEPREIKLPSPQIRVVKIVPETIQVSLDEILVQKVMIKPVFTGEPAFGYQIQTDAIEIDPNAILLEGPKGQLEKLESVMTEKIDTVGRIRSFRRTVELDLPANVKALSEAIVDIFVPIKEEFGEKEFQNVPVRVVEAPGQMVQVDLESKTISFVLKGARQQLEKLTVENIFAYLDVAPLAPGKHEVPVQIVLPENVSLKEPLAVAVTVGTTVST